MKARDKRRALILLAEFGTLMAEIIAENESVEKESHILTIPKKIQEHRTHGDVLLFRQQNKISLQK